MLAEVGHFGVLIDDQHAARLLDAAADRFPVVGENAAQIEHVEAQPVFRPQPIGGLHAQAAACGHS